METDLRKLFEAEFDGEPPLPPVGERVRAGRRALRRRRVGAVSLVAGVVVVVGFGAAQASDEPPPPPLPSQQPTPPPTPSHESLLTSSVPVDRSWTEDCGRGGQATCEGYLNGAAPVGLRADGTVVRTAAEVIIIRRSEAKVSPGGTRRVALELRTPLSPRPCWYVLARDAAGAVSASIADPSMSQISFATWAAAVTRGHRTTGAPDLTSERLIIGEEEGQP